jgi:hypothetical protein
LERRRFAHTATTIIIRTLARLMDIMGRIISWEACLSVRVPGFTADTMAADTTDAVIMTGATMVVITAEVTEAMAAVIMDVAGTKDTKVMVAGATTVVVIKAAEITATTATMEAGTRVVETAVITAAAAIAVVEIAFMGVEANPMAADTVVVDTGKSK